MKIRQMGGDDDNLVLKIEGRISQNGFAENPEPLDEFLPGWGTKVPKMVHIDLSDSDFIDSSGIGWLIRCHHRIAAADGSLVLHAPTPNVARSFKLLKLERVLRIDPSPYPLTS